VSGTDPVTGTASGSYGVGAPDAGRSSTETRSLGEIVGEVTADLSTLMKQELDLAKIELKQEATNAGKGAGMLAGAGVAGHLLIVFLSLALMFLLDNWLPIEAAALITAVLWGVVAAVLAQIGRKNLKKATPPLPKTQQTLKEDAQWAKTQTS
jgi:uncharacterized membrane protein YqjE